MKKLIPIAAALLATALATTVPTVEAAKRDCVKTRKVVLESASSPSGEPWTAWASVRNNGSDCGEWLFQVHFRLPEIVSWASATGIPAGGHTSRYFSISALDADSPLAKERVFSGYTGREAARVVATFGDGTRAEIRPRFPSLKLRRSFVWMRSFRYFVYYYSPGPAIEAISLFTKGGRLLYRTKSEEGSFS